MPKVIERTNTFAFEAENGAVVCGRLAGFRRYVSVAGEHTPRIKEGDRARLRFVADGIVGEGEVLEVEHLGNRLEPDYHRTLILVRLDETKPEEERHG